MHVLKGDVIHIQNDINPPRTNLSTSPLTFMIDNNEIGAIKLYNGGASYLSCDVVSVGCT